MVIKSGMFDSVNRDRVYFAKDWADYFSSFIGNGVFPNPSTGLKIVADAGMTITLKPGRGWIFGYYIVNTEDYSLQLDIADAVLKRVDRVVLQLNYLERAIKVVVHKGAYASTPVAKTVQRNADVYELVLADILVSNGVIQITQANITDQRLNTSLCGIVHGLINQVDTTAIFEQYQAFFTEYSITKVDEFNEWTDRLSNELETWINDQENSFTSWRSIEQSKFSDWVLSIKDILDTNVAGNILLEIEAHKDAIMPHKYVDVSDNKTYKYGLRRNPERNCVTFIYEEE